MQLRIIATDNGDYQLTATALAEITILRNMQRPSFGSVFINETVIESAPRGYVVTTLTASDSDRFSPWNTVRYRFAAGSSGQDNFQIDAVSGVISIKEELQCSSVSPIY